MRATIGFLKQMMRAITPKPRLEIVEVNSYEELCALEETPIYGTRLVICMYDDYYER